jgi:hypothetical protein
MIKELLHASTEDNLKILPIDSVLMDDWEKSIEHCKEKMVLYNMRKVYIYSCLPVMHVETTKRKTSIKYDCSFWKSVQEIKLDERWSITPESIKSGQFDRIDL